MRWRDVVRLAGRSVMRRVGRSLLTVVAVALAAALFSALLTVSRTAEVRVLDEIAEGGPLTGIAVAAAEPDPTQVDLDDAKPGEPRDLDDAALAEIAALPDVNRVIPLVTTRVALPAPDRLRLKDGSSATTVLDRDGAATTRTADAHLSMPVWDKLDVPFETLVGADVRHARDLPITILAGRLPRAGSHAEVAVTPAWLARFGLEGADAERVVGLEVELGAPRSFGGSGNAIRSRWIRSEIVGVVTQEATAGAVLAPIEAVRTARAWTLAGEDDDRVDVISSPYAGVFVVVSGLDHVASVREAIHDIGYSTSAPESLIAGAQRWLRVVEIVLGGIGLIALGIAATGVANALLAAVRERQREIGVLKAIGARDRDVLRLFLIEATVLGILGGLLGTLTGFGLAALVGTVVNGFLQSEGLTGVALHFPLRIGIATVAGSALLAVLAGSLPARRAARLPAREAVDA